jgi:hypothetical protein
MQRLQELSIIPALVATTRARGFKHLQRHVPIRFGHTRQQCRLPYRPTPYESRLTRFVNLEASVRSRGTVVDHGLDRDLIEAGLSEPAGWRADYGDFAWAEWSVTPIWAFRATI